MAVFLCHGHYRYQFGLLVTFSKSRYGIGALSWMFRQSRIPWESLLQLSVHIVLRRYGITEGNIGIDDTDKKRSKSTTKISYVHKIQNS